MKVSLITVCFNSALTLGDTINSVAGQTSNEFEYIVVDGGSTDNTLRIINDNAHIIDKFISEPDNGLYDAMNKGIAIAEGDVIGFINSDDILNSPDCIEVIQNEFAKSEVDVVFGNNLFCDARDLMTVTRVWRPGCFSVQKFQRGWMPPHLSTYIKADVYRAIGGYRTDMRIAADYELLLRVFLKTPIREKYIDFTIARMREGGISNSSLKNIIISNWEVYKSWQLNGLSVSPLIMLIKPLTKIFQIRFWR